MFFDNTQNLLDIFNNVEVFMLVLVRVVGLLITLPVLGGGTIPTSAKLGFAMAITGVIYSSGFIAVDPQFNIQNVAIYGMLILKEFLVGLIIGFIVFFIFNAVYFSGHISDQQIGYSISSIFDPTSNAQVPITGNLYYFALCALFIVNKGHYMVINTIYYSYKALPIGKAFIVGNENLTKLLLYTMTQFFIIGTLFSLPIIGIILIMDVSLGVLVKTVPKVNVFAVGMPLKAIAGLIALWIIIPAFSDIYIRIFSLLSENILNAIKVLMQ